jgi:hypothetical protein
MAVEPRTGWLSPGLPLHDPPAPQLLAVHVPPLEHWLSRLQAVPAALLHTREHAAPGVGPPRQTPRPSSKSAASTGDAGVETSMPRK